MSELLRCLLHSKPFLIAQNRYRSRSSPTPEVREPYGSIWRGLELADNPHTADCRGSNSEPRKGSKADIAGNAWAPLPKAMSGNIDCSPVALAYRVFPH